MSTLGVDLSKVLSAPPAPPPAQTLISPHAAKGHRPNPQTLLPRPAAPQQVFLNPETDNAPTAPISRSLSSSPHPLTVRANALPPLPPHPPPSATKTPSSAPSSSSLAAARRRSSAPQGSRSPPPTRLAPVPDLEHANSTSLLSLDEGAGNRGSHRQQEQQQQQKHHDEESEEGPEIRRSRGSDSGGSGEIRPLDARYGSGFLDVLAAPALKWAGLKRKLRYPVPECLGRENDFCSYLTMYEQEQDPMEQDVNAAPGPMAVGKSKRRYVAVMKDKAYMLARADSSVASVILHLPECRIEPSPRRITSPPPNLFAIYMPPGGTSSGGGDYESGSGGTPNTSPPGGSPLSRGGSTSNLAATKGRYFLCVAGNEVDKHKWVAALERGKTGQEYTGPKEAEPESAATRLVLRTSSLESVNDEEG
ncbi:hypothetical protein HDU87_002398 [Geranomyces variabilis]|uniref:PH domain-containing protein n=1 Tax=Geranomyces variabilis TaxID=109894 RepID=A0AAD5XR97_9FUNG|nr:hypothetical protein HDU87_002398 [Geranomyces variabilis]